jgi:hypothetical protein
MDLLLSRARSGSVALLGILTAAVVGGSFGACGRGDPHDPPASSGTPSAARGAPPTVAPTVSPEAIAALRAHAKQLGRFGQLLRGKRFPALAALFGELGGPDGEAFARAWRANPAERGRILSATQLICPAARSAHADGLSAIAQACGAAYFGVTDLADASEVTYVLAQVNTWLRATSTAIGPDDVIDRGLAALATIWFPLPLPARTADGLPTSARVDGPDDEIDHVVTLGRTVTAIGRRGARMGAQGLELGEMPIEADSQALMVAPADAPAAALRDAIAHLGMSARLAVRRADHPGVHEATLVATGEGTHIVAAGTVADVVAAIDAADARVVILDELPALTLRIRSVVVDPPVDGADAKIISTLQSSYAPLVIRCARGAAIEPRLRFSVNATFHVVDVEVGDVPDATVAACLRASASRWLFRGVAGAVTMALELAP